MRTDFLQLSLGHREKLRPDLAAVAAVDQRDEQLATPGAPVQHAVDREIGVDSSADGSEVDRGRESNPLDGQGITIQQRNFDRQDLARNAKPSPR